MRRCIWLVLAVACSSANRPTPSLTVTGGELILRTPDGRVLHTQDLIGATVATTSYVVRIDATKRDEESPDVWLYRMTVLRPGAAETALCANDASGEEWALPFLDDSGQTSFACTSGAIGKCILMGYPPAKPSAPNHRLHNACIRMIRADYGGDGASMTRDGMRIGFCDRAGVHPCRQPHDIEAAWSDDGAMCVAYPRIAALVTLDELARKYPRLAGRLGSNCSADAAPGALLYSWLAR